MHRPIPLLLAIVLLGASVAAAGSAPRSPAGGRFAELDRNGDGAVDRGEAAAISRLAERFDRVDRDGNQRLEPAELRKAARLAASRRELAKARREAMRARFVFLDRDGDRRLTLAEIGTDAPRLASQFSRIDRDRDGRIGADELREHLKAEREARRAARAG